MLRLIAAIDTLEGLQSQRDALQKMAAAMAEGRQATLMVADHPGGIDVDAATANRVVNTRLTALNTQIADLETRLEDAESRL